MSRIAAGALALLLLPSFARAQDAAAFGGEWKNPKETKGIVGARVYSQAGRWMVQLLGACVPTPCVWEPQPLTLKQGSLLEPVQPATATESISNMRRLITLRLGEDALSVEVASHQLAVPARGIGERRYTSVDELVRVKPTTTPLPPLVRGPKPPARK
jgi:hypothetical protein